MVRGARPAIPPDRAFLPVRTCVGCRKRASTSELLRVVATGPADGVIVLEPDPARVRPGRGAHLHPDPACLTLAERRRAFGRALRVTGVTDAGALWQLLGTPDGGASPRPNQQGRTTDMGTR
ncbi:YlxR family protein [Rugosimonospora acidiphila]|uniref:YlxR family protein n=1 Tax=Rugosimonospora acidiphila TaxID=556531 RepID=UPI003CD0A78A